MPPEPERIDTVIQGGDVVTHQSVTHADLAIAGAKVVAIGDSTSWPSPTSRTIDASGCYVLPGLIDPHVHLMGVFSIDDFRSGSIAAAFGGVTTIMDFAFQHCQFLNGRDGTIRDGLRDKQHLATGNSVVDYTWHCAITRENEETLDELAAIVDDERIPSFKFFMTYPFGVTRGIMYDAFARIADLGGTASVHAEDRELVLGNGDLTGYLASRYKRQGHVEPIWFARSRPHFAETIALSAALFLAEETGVQMYQVHQSAAGACELLRQAKARGLPVAAETCPHYLTLDEQVYEEQGPLPIMCPPIRTSDDRSRLWRGIADGTIDTIGTDHAPFTREQKLPAWRAFWLGQFGAAGLETSLPVMYEQGVASGRLTMPDLVRLTSYNPARLFGLLPQKGQLAPGADADLVIFDPHRQVVIQDDMFQTRSDYSLFSGMTVSGWPILTMLRGTTIVEDGRLTGEHGFGQFVPRSRPNWRA